MAGIGDDCGIDRVAIRLCWYGSSDGSDVGTVTGRRVNGTRNC
jgi:hypothetical protein